LREKEFGSLTIMAPTAGTVLPAPRELPPTDENELPSWTGSPLEPENVGCYLERGTLLCLVGNPNSYEAFVLIDETDLPYVKTGQSVRLQVKHAPTNLLTGRVVEIAEVKAETAPAELVSQHDVAVHETKSHGQKLIRTLYQARVEIEDSQLPLLAGTRGTVRIKVEPQTAVEKLLRWIRQTFEIEPKA
jgi:putative peptide zinc metalloprotease protein